MTIRLLVVGCILVIAPAWVVAQPARGDASAREEYAVYSTLISQKFVRDDTRLVVITNPTCCANEDLDVWRMKALEPFSADTLESFKTANKQSVHLEREFTLSVTYRIVDYKSIEELFASIMLDESWNKFYEMYPQSNGYLRLSRVGFNKERTEALVSTGWMRGELYGEGKWYLLTKVNGAWRVQRSVGTWIS